MASPNLDEITSTTLRNRSGKLADNMSQNTALLSRLKEKGKIKLKSGGRNITQELEYAENATYKRYSGYETLNVSASDVITAAEYSWKQAAAAVTISGLELLQNSGKEAVIDLLDSRISNAEKTLINNLSSDLYSDGTADGGKQITGLQAQVPDDPTTGTVGGINAATYTFWRSKKFDCSSDGGAAMSSTNAQTYMNQMWVQLVRNNEKPDLIVADNNYWRFYLESLQAIQRITDDKMAQAGFMNLKYMTADVVLDGGVSGDAPSNHMYFLNTDYIYWVAHKDRNLVPIGSDRFAVNQDAMVKLIGFAGNLVSSNRSLQGVIIA